jgi:two-component system, NarL family, response regulator
VGRESTIGVLIADDHPVVREGLAALIARHEDMHVVGEATNGNEAVEMFQQQAPDVTLMDLRMPGVDGVTAINMIRDRNPNARIIILTTYDGDHDIYRGLRAGAKSYLLKDANRSDLLDTIRAVHSGETLIPPTVAAKLAQHMSQPELTAREVDVLKLMSAGCSNQEIGRRLFIAEGTVKAHVNNILNKLNVNDRTQAVTLALRRGLVQLN